MDEASKKLVADVRDQLLQGLADDAETIRQVCFLFVFLTASLSLSLSLPLCSYPFTISVLANITLTADCFARGGGVSIVNKQGMFDDCITHHEADLWSIF